MNWRSVRRPGHVARGGRYGALLRVIAALLAVCTVLAARPAGHAVADSSCQSSTSIVICPSTYPPPPLLNLSQPLYAATPAQAASLQILETQAITTTIADHGLASTDGNAVQSWARDDADAELYALLAQAIATDPSARTADQQNAVAWLTAVDQRQAVQAAQDAGFQYVQWAGLDQSSYLANVGSWNESQLQNFLSGPVLNYNLINSQGQPIDPSAGYTAAQQSTGGYCVYHSPAPDQSQYTGYDDQTCFTPCTNLLGCSPPTPSYDQFVQWGEDDANYQALNSAQFAQAAHNIAVGLGFGLAAGGATAALAIVPAALIYTAGGTLGAASTVLFPFAATAAVTVAGVAAIVAFVLIAIAIAVVALVQLLNANALPSQLAQLITGAETTPPNLQTLLSDPQQAPSLYSLFVGATLPEPLNQTCDNSSSIIIVGGGTSSGAPAPCLNATAIPAPSNTDPEFKVQANGTTTYTSTITLKDVAANTITTARLSANWFIDQVTSADGATSTVQTLRIAYTDWSGKEQNAWLLDTSAGYRFLGFAVPSDTSTSVTPSTCISSGICFFSQTIDYVGSDGADYAASVVPAQVPVVNPSVSANPVEGSPVTFAANGSSPIGLPITYQWQFEQPSNGIIVVIGGQTYNYTDPVSGPTASYVWTTSGTYHVQLTATDAAGKVTVDTFTVNIGDVAPTLTLASTPNALLGCLQLACNTYTVPFGSVTSLFGTITHVGSSDTETVSVNWGDGSSVDTSAVNSDIIYLQSPLSLSTVSPTVITFSDTHTYAKPGSYTVTVTVTDQAGGTSTQTATEVAQAAQAISFASIPEHTYGDPPFAITATGGGSGQPVTFTTTTTTVCTVSGATSGTDGSGDGTGGVTVTLHSAGICAIAANQAGTFNAAGTAIYTAAPQDVQTFSVQQAQLTITADNQTTPYGNVPAFTWTGSPWVNGDSSSTLSTSPNSPPTCSATVNGSAESTSAPPGIYAGAIACQGAVDQNYAITYASGTLTINPLISLDEQGLPSTVPHQATLDGATVTLPDLNVVVPYGSPHQYSFPAAVIAPDGTVYLTNQRGFTGAVTANLSSTAAYQTLSQIVAAALASGGIDNHGVATALTQQFRAVQTAIAAHNVPQALSDLQSFASLVQAQSGKHVTTATATGLLADAQLVYASLGGSGTV